MTLIQHEAIIGNIKSIRCQRVSMSNQAFVPWLYHSSVPFPVTDTVHKIIVIDLI